MKHLIWDYNGWNDLKLDFQWESLQKDWNATIFNKICIAFPSDENFNIFCSERVLEILKSSIAFNKKNNTLFGKKIYILGFDTPKIYVTSPEMTDFTMLQPNNHGSVTVKNYGYTV